MKDKMFDAIVVGSGPSGSIAVKELTEQGLKVLLLEAGPYLEEKDFPPQPELNKKVKKIGVLERAAITLTGQPLQARAAYISKEYRHLFVNDWDNPYTTPNGQYYLWIRGRQLGGRLHTYGRVLMRMSDYDFKAASFDGYGDNWPINYADLEPYYDKVEEFLGVYGTKENIKNLPDGKYISAPILTTPEKKFKSNVEKMHPERKVISWRFSAPNLKRVPLGVIAGLETGLLEVRADAVVEKINTDPVTGKATGVTYIDRRSHERNNVNARIVVLCASAIESVRLLLNSKSAKHPNGIGNSSDLLGRYFFEQTPSLIAGSVPDNKGWEFDHTVPQDPYCRPTGGIYIPRYENIGKVTNSDFIRGFGYQGVVGRGYVPDSEPSQFGLMGFGEMLARKENRISLNPRKKDAWGVPAAHIDCTLCENDIKLMTAQLAHIKEMVLESGYQVDFAGTALGLDKDVKLLPKESWLLRQIFRLSFKKSVGIGAAIHESGGARMGTDPSNSVVNAYNQCWDADNILVTDGSCFVTSGTVGPTLTMMAITARACQHIANEFRAGKI